MKQGRIYLQENNHFFLVPINDCWIFNLFPTVSLHGKLVHAVNGHTYNRRTYKFTSYLYTITQICHEFHAPYMLCS